MTYQKLVPFEGISADYQREWRITHSDRWLANIRALFERDGDGCYLCGALFTDTLQPSLDHVVERSRGGRKVLDNLKLACVPCNSSRSNVHPQSLNKLNRAMP